MRSCHWALESAQTPLVKGSGLPLTALTSDHRCTSGVPRPPTLHHLVTNLGVPTTPSGSIIQKNSSPNSLKMLHLQLQFYDKGCASSEVWGPLCPVLCSQRTSLSQHQHSNAHCLGSVTGLQGPEFFIGVSLCRHNWLSHWPCDWTQYPAPSLSPEVEQLKVPTLWWHAWVFWWLVPPLKLPSCLSQVLSLVQQRHSCQSGSSKGV